MATPPCGLACQPATQRPEPWSRFPSWEGDGAADAETQPPATSAAAIAAIRAPCRGPLPRPERFDIRMTPASRRYDRRTSIGRYSPGAPLVKLRSKDFDGHDLRRRRAGRGEHLDRVAGPQRPRRSAERRVGRRVTT